MVGLEPDRLRSLAGELGPGTVWREADVRDGDAPRAAIDGCAQAVGGTDLVVANAGIAAYGTVWQIDEASFERVVDINLTGVFRTVKYATPHLERSRGHVTVVASAVSFVPLAGMAAYGASKSGPDGAPVESGVDSEVVAYVQPRPGWTVDIETLKARRAESRSGDKRPTDKGALRATHRITQKAG
ncbi:probable 3-oxoacyl-(acyl carrier protein) reductase [Amycolatopsis camponoti]|uniref:Probable 3-oxoacyl-(Acyl carrier protein) reductase n=1 Tax=Amycolatopsis camponoti TaxID=2606593 RepID=A0A6I8LS84_9PSEU|nr:probable 3-oxoacyl-(acyl carrier protein) reductase [Amycolatopsis camponoti]